MTRDGHVSAPCPWASLEERVRVGDIKAKSRHCGRKEEGSNPLFGRDHHCNIQLHASANKYGLKTYSHIILQAGEAEAWNVVEIAAVTSNLPSPHAATFCLRTCCEGLIPHANIELTSDIYFSRTRNGLASSLVLRLAPQTITSSRHLCSVLGKRNTTQSHQE
jgi:hypothetical protein